MAGDCVGGGLSTEREHRQGAVACCLRAWHVVSGTETVGGGSRCVRSEARRSCRCCSSTLWSSSAT
eukprot:3265576-Rhodomonas_salina.2